MAFLVAALVGCGEAKPATDPVVGTWRPSSPTGIAPQTLIIARAGDDYLAIVPQGPGFEDRATLIRAGDEFSGGLTGPFVGGSPSPDLPWPEPVVIQYQPASGHLTWSQASPAEPFSSVLYSGMTKPVEMTKVSDSTALPTSSP